jgi:hypothetical protein
MQKLEALRILEAKLASIEQEHGTDRENSREQIDARAEAKALAAVFDFLRDCKISHRASLLRALERYLRKPREKDVMAGEQTPREVVILRASAPSPKANKIARRVARKLGSKGKSLTIQG